MSSYPTPAAATPAAWATIFTTLGQTLRVPLRADTPPENQFISWFNRQLAANPAFPRRVRSILLIPGRRDVNGQVLRRFLRRWQLAGRLRVAPGGAAGGRQSAPRSVATPLDEIMAEAELQGEWWNAVRRLGTVGLSILGLAANPGKDAAPIRTVLTTAAKAQAQRRKTENKVNSNSSKPRQEPGGPPPPPPGFQVPLQNSTPFTGWPTTTPSHGWRTR